MPEGSRVILITIRPTIAHGGAAAEGIIKERVGSMVQMILANVPASTINVSAVILQDDGTEGNVQNLLK